MGFIMDDVKKYFPMVVVCFCCSCLHSIMNGAHVFKYCIDLFQNIFLWFLVLAGCVACLGIIVWALKSFLGPYIIESLGYVPGETKEEEDDQPIVSTTVARPSPVSYDNMNYHVTEVDDDDHHPRRNSNNSVTPAVRGTRESYERVIEEKMTKTETTETKKKKKTTKVECSRKQTERVTKTDSGTSIEMAHIQEFNMKIESFINDKKMLFQGKPGAVDNRQNVPVHPCINGGHSHYGGAIDQMQQHGALTWPNDGTWQQYGAPQYAMVPQYQYGMDPQYQYGMDPQYQYGMDPQYQYTMMPYDERSAYDSEPGSFLAISN